MIKALNLQQISDAFFNLTTKLAHFFAWWKSELAFFVPASIQAKFTDRNIQDITLGEYDCIKDGDLICLRLPETALLSQVISLPQGSETRLAKIIPLQIQKISPLMPGETIYGWHVDAVETDAVRVRVLIAKKHEIESAIDQVHSRGATIINLMSFDGVLLASDKLQQQQRLQGLKSLGQYSFIIAALMIAPFIFLGRMDIYASDLQESAALKRAAAAPFISARRECAKSVRKLRALIGHSDQPKVTYVLDLLTMNIPKTAWVSSFRMEENRVILSGEADDAAALTLQLSNLTFFQKATLMRVVPARDSQAEQFEIRLELAQ